jgi:hypothetical protein
MEPTLKSSRASITARRDDLAAQLENGKRQLETLDRQLCVLAGGIQELNTVLDDWPEEVADVPVHAPD